MKSLKRFLARLGNLGTAWHRQDRFEEEIEQHLALQTAENLHAGMSPVEARRQAALKFGSVEAIKEYYRAEQGLPAVETLLQDTQHVIRRLIKTPVFTLAAILTLALGIGATTVIFTLVHAVLLKSLPVSNPDQLYRLGKESNCCVFNGYSEGEEFSLISNELHRYFRDHTKGFEEMTTFQADGNFFGVRRARSASPAESYFGEFVSGNYFSTFGISAYAGRALKPADDQPGAPPAAIMSFRLWQQKYGLDPSVVGSVFNIDNKPFTLPALV
jgi:MacB-like periplasmic core domain